MAIGSLFDDISLSVIYAVLGGILGMLFMGVIIMLIPKIMGKLTPRIDEEKELMRGNMAVATYYGQIVHAVILGFSIIIAAAIFVGIM